MLATVIHLIEQHFGGPARKIKLQRISEAARDQPPGSNSTPATL